MLRGSLVFIREIIRVFSRVLFFCGGRVGGLLELFFL